MLEKELARTAVLVEKLQSAREGHRVGKKNISKMLLRAQAANDELSRFYKLMSSETARAFFRVRNSRSTCIRAFFRMRYSCSTRTLRSGTLRSGSLRSGLFLGWAGLFLGWVRSVLKHWPSRVCPLAGLGCLHANPPSPIPVRHYTGSGYWSWWAGEAANRVVPANGGLCVPHFANKVARGPFFAGCLPG